MSHKLQIKFPPVESLAAKPKAECICGWQYELAGEDLETLLTHADRAPGSGFDTAVAGYLCAMFNVHVASEVSRRLDGHSEVNWTIRSSNIRTERPEPAHFIANVQLYVPGTDSDALSKTLRTGQITIVVPK